MEQVEWIEHQLHVLAEYGFNEYSIHFYSEEEISMDPTLSPGDFEAYEIGLLGHDLLENCYFKQDTWRNPTP